MVIKEYNGSLYNNPDTADRLWRDSFNKYKVTFKDGTVKYTRARCKSDAEDNTCWINDEDHYEDIVSVEEIDESLKESYNEILDLKVDDLIKYYNEDSDDTYEEVWMVAGVLDKLSGVCDGKTYILEPVTKEAVTAINDEIKNDSYTTYLVAGSKNYWVVGAYSLSQAPFMKIDDYS